VKKRKKDKGGGRRDKERLRWGGEGDREWEREWWKGHVWDKPWYA